MKDNLFHVVLAISLVTGTWIASHSAPVPAAFTSVAAIRPIDPAADVDVMDLRTGDSFWGFYLCGVVPCSTLVVKGGGHLVTLSYQNDRDARFFFHVVKEKTIEIHGQTFQLRVAAPDQIHVERGPQSNATVATR